MELGKTIVSNILTISVLKWALKVFWNGNFDYQMDSETLKRSHIENKYIWDPAEMYCQGRDTHAMLAQCAAGHCRKLMPDSAKRFELQVSEKLFCCSLSTVSDIFRDDVDDNDGDYDANVWWQCRRKRIKPDFAQFYKQSSFL